MQILGIPNSYASAPVNAPTSLSNVPAITSVAISFTAPTNDGGSAITNYEYSFNNSSWTAFSPVDTTSPVTVSGLTANTAYSIYLRAVNIIGAGPASSATSFTTNKAAPSTVEYLVIGGGGGGSGGDLYTYQGAGGAGGTRRQSTSFAVSTGTALTVTVGAGGTQTGTVTANSGAASVFSSVSASGGGGGSGRTGGSNADFSGATYNASIDAGGGAGSGGSASGMNGGTFTTSSINGTSTNRAGGGYGATGGTAGGGGTAAGNSAATANTGAGGNGREYYAQTNHGGSGIVIIAYSTSFAAAVATTGSPTYSTASRSGFHVYTFTGSGSITF
jgi:hypothetical protein